MRIALLSLFVLLNSTSLAKESSQPQLDASTLARADREITSAISTGRIPGAVLHIERNGQVYRKAFGKKATYPRSLPNSPDTIYDAASLTKVVATTPCILLLVEQGKLDLSDPVSKHIPEFAGNDPNKATITLRHLLTHTSGLLAGIRKGHTWSGYENGIALACGEPTVDPPGEVYRYSDLNFILLGEVVRRVSGQPLNEFVAGNLFAPLKMSDTGFLPPKDKFPRIAPTTRLPGSSVLRGSVHDPTSRAMGGVAGHAGLFTTASDLARFARMLINGGELGGARILSEESVHLMTTVQSPPWIPQRRALGMDIDSPYASLRGDTFPPGSFGHTGWTGTSLWVDPFSETFVIFLSNRNHPTERGSVSSLRKRLGTIAASAVVDFDFKNVPGALQPISTTATNEAQKTRPRRDVATVLNGIDVLSAAGFAPLKGLKVGLITNHTGIDRSNKPTIDLLHAAKDVNLAALFSPEHGIRGTADTSVIRDGVDKKTGLKIHSLYSGAKRKPSSAQLAGLDALVFDIQDIGCRFYTYISTMGLCMEAAEEAGIKFFVLDRVNPIGGESVDGPVLGGARSFTGFHEIPVRHGMTVGELARMFKTDRYPKLDLTVVPLEGWKRDLYFDQTSLPWRNPSPNMRSLPAAILYPGVGLLEFTNLSVGRGTRFPFELVGAPYIDGEKWASALRAAALPGVTFVPARFSPDASVFKGEACGGLRLIVTDRKAFRSVDLGIEMAKTLHRLYPERWQTKNLNKLLVHPETDAAIKADAPLTDIHKLWYPGRATFAPKREAALLYE